MAKLLDTPRYKCALAAIQSIQGMNRILPVLHSGPGCASKLSDDVGNSGYISPNIYPCTGINEKDVVFGGVKKLDTTIENSLKVIDADMYVVLTGCIPEIIGDNTGEIVDKYRNAEKPVIYAPTAGFKGNNFVGHQQIIDAIVDQYLQPSDEKIEGLVNIWADIPLQDPFWLGDIEQLEKLVKSLGLTPNSIFGYNSGIDAIDLVPKAQFNLLVSPWVGVSSMENMKRKLGIDYLHCPVLPIGATETTKFLKKVGEFAGVSEEKIKEATEAGEKYFYHYIERYADLFLESRVMPKKFSVVGDTHTVLGITKFLVNDLGLFPATQFAVEDVPKKYRKAIEEEFKDLNYGIESEIWFESDGYKIHNNIRETSYHGHPLILGAHYEKKLAKELGGLFLAVSWPVNDRLVMNGSYVGYEGGLRLLEDIYSVARQRFY